MIAHRLPLSERSRQACSFRRRLRVQLVSLPPLFLFLFVSATFSNSSLILPELPFPVNACRGWNYFRPHREPVFFALTFFCNLSLSPTLPSPMFPFSFSRAHLFLLSEFLFESSPSWKSFPQPPRTPSPSPLKSSFRFSRHLFVLFSPSSALQTHHVLTPPFQTDSGSLLLQAFFSIILPFCFPLGTLPREQLFHSILLPYDVRSLFSLRALDRPQVTTRTSCPVPARPLRTILSRSDFFCLKPSLFLPNPFLSLRIPP